MKHKLFLLFFLAGLLNTNAQKLTQKAFLELQLNSYKKTLKQALKYNDLETAIYNIHNIISIEGEQSVYKDSLAIAYYQRGKYLNSHLVVKELLKSKPNNTQLLEINAVSLQKLNAVKEAIDAYEVLFKSTNNMAHGYQLANLQYSIKRLSEAKITMDKTLQCKEIEKAYIPFAIDNKQQQNIPLKAAAYNLVGLISFDLKNYQEAQNSFKEALKIAPKFAIATQNANAVLISIQNEKKNKKVSKN